MVDPADKERLARLDAQIAAAKKTQAPAGPKGDDHYTQAGMAWQMVIELVAGLAIGFGIGYGLDALFGTMPVFMVLFILLGFAAGVRVMLRSARDIQQKIEAQQADNDERG